MLHQNLRGRFNECEALSSDNSAGGVIRGLVAAIDALLARRLATARHCARLLSARRSPSIAKTTPSSSVNFPCRKTFAADEASRSKRPIRQRCKHRAVQRSAGVQNDFAAPFVAADFRQVARTGAIESSGVAIRITISAHDLRGELAMSGATADCADGARGFGGRTRDHRSLFASRNSRSARPRPALRVQRRTIATVNDSFAHDRIAVFGSRRAEIIQLAHFLNRFFGLIAAFVVDSGRPRGLWHDEHSASRAIRATGRYKLPARFHSFCRAATKPRKLRRRSNHCWRWIIRDYEMIAVDDRSEDARARSSMISPRAIRDFK